MLFIQPMKRLWHRRFERSRWQSLPKGSSEKDCVAIADASHFSNRHHVEAIKDLQKVRRNYFLERGTFL